VRLGEPVDAYNPTASVVVMADGEVDEAAPLLSQQRERWGEPGVGGSILHTVAVQPVVVTGVPIA
jgi:hypothetical protein